MKKIIFCVAFLCSSALMAQENGSFFGGLESNSQWLLADDGIDFEAPEDQFRANNYFQLNYNLGNFTAGVQYESYLPSALLGYSPTWNEQNGIGTYYLNFKNETLDVTGGYFYEQFGSGLILRSWEDRQLGINNALKGVRVNVKATEFLDLTGVFGQQRIGFDVSEGTIQGIDVNADISNALNIEKVAITMGASYVARYQDRGANDTIPKVVNAYGGRLDFVAGDFYGGVEAITKDPDVIANEGILSSNKLYDGTALLVNVGYGKRGVGINATFRRLENFSFFSDRLAEGNVFNEQVINFVPGLTKQQDYLLTNIFVYNPQPRLIIETIEQRSGEVGTQVDFFYSFKGDNALAKVKTKIAANFSYWAGLDAEYNIPNRWYEAKFIGKGPRYFRDYSVEIKNKWSKSFNTIVTFQDVVVDKGIVEGGTLGNQGDFHSYIAVVEGTYKFSGTNSIRGVIQHLWSKNGEKNTLDANGDLIDVSILDGDWAGAVLEYNFSSALALYVADAWNYGGSGENHYYNLGGSYTKGRTRLGVNYGRQRGGLICVGGVCRFVPTNNGVSANLAITF